MTCFEDDPCSNVSAEPTFASPTTQLPTATSVASPPHTTTGTDSIDPTNSSSGKDSSIPETNVGAPRSDPLGTTYTIIIIFIAVCIIAAFFLTMAVMFAVVKYKMYKHSDTILVSVHLKKSESIAMERRQQESYPVYETIMTMSENTAMQPMGAKQISKKTLHMKQVQQISRKI